MMLKSLRRESIFSLSKILVFLMEKVRRPPVYAFLCWSIHPLYFSLASIEDELTNTDLARAEFDRKKAELKKANKGYTGYDDDEFDPSMSTVGMKKKVLTKYDVDIEGEADSVGSATFYVLIACVRGIHVGFLIL